MPPDNNAEVDRPDGQSGSPAARGDADVAERAPAASPAPVATATATPAAPDWEDRARRAAADADNQRKRHSRELQETGARERAAVAARWLPVIDNLELALRHAQADPTSIIEGVRAVRDQAVAILAQLGFERRDESGVPFDPSQHEVVSVVEQSDAPPGTVVRVLRPGYGDAERQLRPVAVAVSRKPD
ncbi:MAG: molecular chaperone GrpE [Pseudonocardiales bacterium]|nr:molecular chaperone GrpE [Pseudonocardiales bacterium]